MPTPTPIPNDQTEEEKRVQKTEFLAAVSDFEAHSELTYRLFEELQEGAITAEVAAQLLRATALRNETLCRGWQIIARPMGTAAASAEIETELKWRQIELKSAADALAAAGTMPSDTLATSGYAVYSSLLTRLAVGQLAATVEVELPAERAESIIASADLSIELMRHAEWLVVRNDTQLVLLAPPSYQEDQLHGPEEWRIGTATRITRIRNGDDWNFDTAIAIGRHLLSVSGEAVERVEIETGEGLPGERQEFEDADSNWRYLVDIVIGPEYTYFFQTGCPASEESCEQLADSIVSGATLN